MKQHEEGRGARTTSSAIRSIGKARRFAEDAWRAVVKSGERGAFLIRRRQDAWDGLCPFHCFSVTRVARDTLFGVQPRNPRHRRAGTRETR